MSWKGWAFTEEEGENFAQLRAAEDIPLIQAGIYQIINTVPGERRMLPEFGSRVRSLVFDPHDAILYTEIGREVIRAVERWEPRIVLEDVQIQKDPANEHAVRAYVVWRLKANRRVSSRTEIKVRG